MLKVNIVCVGKIKEKYIEQGIDEFLKRMQKFAKLEIIELKDEVDVDFRSSIEKESNKIIFHLNKLKSYFILLDVKGEHFNSMEFAKKINDLTLSYSDVTFIIGGSNGVNDEVREKVDLRWSFSNLTFPHQLMRLILLEQIYRCFTINNNIKYHK